MKTAEQQLREKVVSIISSWEGYTRGSSGHLKILNIYNSYTPLARGYALTQSDAWCAGTVSATWIEAGIAEYTGTECSCTAFINIAKSKDYWTENDDYVPQIGDAIIYDWDDNGVGENTGGPEHIGIVISVSGSKFCVMEGNMGSPSQVGRRNMTVNGKYIRGFITPDYKTIAALKGYTDLEEKIVNYKAIVTSSTLNCRSGPSTDYQVLTFFVKDTELTITKEYDGWGYCGYGWVSLIYLEKIEEDNEMTQEKFNEFMDNWLAEQANKAPSDWSLSARMWAEQNGFILGNAEGNKMYKKPMTREELVQILFRVMTANDNK